MSDDDALADVPDGEMEAALPDRPVVTLRDIEVVYGTLYALATAGSGEYASYLSPDAASGLRGDTEGVLVVRIDLTGEQPRLAVDHEDGVVGTAAYDDSMLSRIAHSKYESARGVDHSLTHETGQSNDAEKHADHVVDRFTRWATEDPVRETAAEHADGGLLDAVQTLGEEADTMEQLHKTVLESGLVPEPRHSLVTVAFRVGDDADYETTDAYDESAEFHYPGEFTVFQEAMAARKTAKFASKNDAGDAVGEGTCYVFDTDEAVYGVVDDPMKSYLSKQAERFPRLDADQSWRTQGLSRDAAVAAQNATPFLDACQYGGPGVSVYCLPYFVDEMDATDARELYGLLTRQAEATDDQNPVETVVGTRREARDRDRDETDLDGDRLRFHVQIVHKYQKDRWRLLAGQSDASLRPLVGLADVHLQTVYRSRWLGVSGAFRSPDGFGFFGPESVEAAAGLLAGPRYFAETCLGEDTDDPSSDDFRFRATARVLAGQPVSAEELLNEYVAKLDDRFDPDADEYAFPDAIVAEQYAQLRVLADRGLLDNTTTDLTYMTTPDTDAPNTETTDAERAAADPTALNRDEKFDQFLAEHDRLDHPGRRGVFALGALVGRVTRYQRGEDKSTTAVKNHPVSGLTLNNLDRTAAEVVERNLVYSDEESLKTVMYGELMRAVSDNLEAADPTGWDLSTHDVRFHYAMGIAYGLSDDSTSGHDDD